MMSQNVLPDPQNKTCNFMEGYTLKNANLIKIQKGQLAVIDDLNMRNI